MSTAHTPSRTTSLKSIISHDLLASVVVFLVALPLCMGIAIASGASVAAGLVTGIVGGLVVGALAGSPLQVSGPTAGLAVLTYQAIETHGIEMLGVIVLLAGCMQIAAGARGWRPGFVQSHRRQIKGMLTGMGILIFASQFHVMVDDKPKGSGLSNLASIPEAVRKGLALPQLASLEERDFRTRALKDLGELHRRQQDLGVRVAEGLHDLPPSRESAGSDSPADPDLAEAQAALVAEQRSINNSLRRVTAEMAAVARDPQHHLSSALKSARKVEASLSAALADLETGNTEGALESQTAAAAALGKVLDRLKSHHLAAYIGIATILLLLAWQAFVPRNFRIVPAPLVAIVVTTSMTTLLSLPVLFVEIPNQPLANLHFVTPSLLAAAPWFGLLQSALVIAVSASAETLLCAVAVDRLHSGPRTNFDRELWAQGVGNVVCGLLGALPMTGVIVRSAANVQTGGRSRWSAILHGVWLLIFVVWLSALLRLVPTSGLAAILVYTGYKLINPQTLRELYRYGKGEVFIYSATVIMIVCVNLITGVLTGVVLSAFKLLYTFSHLKIRLTERQSSQLVLSLEGAATFMRLPRLAETLEAIGPQTEVNIDLSRLRYIDHACLDLISSWAQQHETAGGRVVVDWDRLHARFLQAPGLPAGDAEPSLRRSA
ncbi:MAG: SulP family inorganic anion transporter [Planctomycetaceae bacterium]